MKVYVLPADAHGCGHYRLIWPANVLQKSPVPGVDVQIMPPRRDSGFMAKIENQEDGTQLLKGLSIPEDADVLVIQRPAYPLQPQMIKMLRANKIALVVDMDDDMSSIDPGNIAFQAYRHHSKSPYSWKYATESCKVATLVTTSTKQLQRVYAKHGRGVVIDNYVPEAYLDFESPECGGTFGWAGTTASHPNDLQVTRPSVQRLIDEGHPFKVVGGPSKVKDALKLTEEPTYTGATNLRDWASTIASTLDVGMVPLAPSAFNTSKSRLKGIELMAVGIPWVASPREEYRKLHRESGCGLLAADRKDWYTQLKRLLTDEVLRKEQIEAGRDYMKDQTYQAQAWRWAEAWQRALEIERG